MGRYGKKVPTLISNTISNADELSRWILDWNGIQYIDERHAPGLHVGPSNRAAGNGSALDNNPVLVTTDDAIRRNLSGLIIGALPTNAKAVVLVLDELLDRPEELQCAKEAAARGDIETVRRYAYEALRFNPHNPVIARFAARAQTLRGSDGKIRELAAGSTVIVGLSAAMFDPERFPAPDRFDHRRDPGFYDGPFPNNFVVTFD